MTIADITILPNNELTDQPYQIYWNHKIMQKPWYGIPGPEGRSPRLPYPKNGPSCKLLTDALKGPYEEVPWAECGQGAVVHYPWTS